MSSVLESPFKLMFKYDLNFVDNQENIEDNFSYSILEYGDKLLAIDTINTRIDSINIIEYNKNTIDFAYELWDAILAFEGNNEMIGAPVLFNTYEIHIKDMEVGKSKGYCIYVAYEYGSYYNASNQMECFIEKNLYDSNEEIQYLVKQLSELKEPKKIYKDNKVEVDHIVELSGKIIRFSND